MSVCLCIPYKPTVDWLTGQTSASPHFSQEGGVIAQGFGFTGGFLDEWNNSVYCRVQKITCRFKELARIRHSCEKCGLIPLLKIIRHLAHIEL